MADALGMKPGRVVHSARGCAECGQTGYQGRVGVFEALRVDDTIRQMIHDNADEAAIARHAFAATPTLAKAVRRMVKDGTTSPEEAARIMRRDG